MKNARPFTIIDFFHLTEQEYRDYEQGRGPAWEEEQRRKTEQEKKRLESERLEE
jgi:hypothetical protein